MGLPFLRSPRCSTLSEEAVSVSRQVEKKRSTLRGRTQINLFFEASTRTQSSFELAGKAPRRRRHEHVGGHLER